MVSELLCVHNGSNPAIHNFFHFSGLAMLQEGQTRRESLKSALYLRLKKRNVFRIKKGRPFGLHGNPVCCKILKTLKGTLWRLLNIFSKKKTKNENFETVSVCQKTKIGRPFGIFGTSVCCKIFQKIEGRQKIFEEKSR